MEYMFQLLDKSGKYYSYVSPKLCIWPDVSVIEDRSPKAEPAHWSRCALIVHVHIITNYINIHT